VTDLPVEIIHLLKSYLVSPRLALRIEIQFPPDYPFNQPIFILHNERNYALPRNVTAFFAEKKFYGNDAGSTLRKDYLPLIKEECEREIDQKNETGYKASCAPHVIKLNFAENQEPEYMCFLITDIPVFYCRSKRVRYCHKSINHYKTIMETIPEKFRGMGKHRIMLNDRNMTSRTEKYWDHVRCGCHFEVFLGFDT
jgi:hypothetical protein